jgi:hypothetical protein
MVREKERDRAIGEFNPKRIIIFRWQYKGGKRKYGIFKAGSYEREYLRC